MDLEIYLKRKLYEMVKTQKTFHSIADEEELKKLPCNKILKHTKTGVYLIKIENISEYVDLLIRDNQTVLEIEKIFNREYEYILFDTMVCLITEKPQTSTWEDMFIYMRDGQNYLMFNIINWEYQIL